MGKTKIEWCEESWNLWHGCTKIAAGCKNCYAELWYWRHHGRGSNFKDIIMYPERLEQPLHWKKPRRIFVNSMSDLFNRKIPAGELNQIHDIIKKCSQHTFIVLTKRVGYAREYYNYYSKYTNLPISNLWFGVSISTQEDADRLIPILLQIKAKVIFVSFEPLLERIKVKPEWLKKPSWCIIGAESGPKARYCDIEHIRDLKNECQEAGVPVFIKQIHWGIAKVLLKNINDFPKDLQIREYPKAR